MAARKVEDLLETGEFAKAKKRVNSRRKGNTFERQIAKVLNGRFGTTDFNRSPGSGAYATTHNLPAHLKIYGDLITPLGFRFVIECKSGYNLELDDPFKRNSDLWSFIKQAQGDATAADRDWMVIYKKNNRTKLVITDVPLEVKQYLTLRDSKGKEYFVYDIKKVLELPDEVFFIKE